MKINLFRDEAARYGATILLVAAGMTTAAPLLAEDKPKLVPYVFLGIQHDSNLFRLSGNDEARAVLGSTSLADTITQYGAGMEMAFFRSRQFIELDLEINRYEHDRYDFIDYTDLLTQARWNWLYGRLWDGDIGIRYHEDISPFSEFQQAVKDERTYTDLYASARRKLTPRWDTEFSYHHVISDHQRSSRDFLDRNDDCFKGGLNYVSAADSDTYYGFSLETCFVDYPNRETVASTRVDNSYVQENYDFIINWEATPKTGFYGELGYTVLGHDEFSERDFTGVTGSFTFDYRPKDHYGIEFSTWRKLDARTDSLSSYVTESGTSLTPFLQYTFKVRFEAEYALLHRDFSGDPLAAVTNADEREDNVRTFTLGLTYSQNERLDYTVAYENEDRRSNQDDREYTYNLITGRVQMSF